MVTKIVSLVMPEELIEKVDKIRGDIPRSAYVRRLIDNEIARLSKGGKTK